MALYTSKTADLVDRAYAGRNVPPDFDASRLEVLDPMVIEIMRRKTPAERLQIAFQLNRFVRSRIREHLRDAHPEWTDQQVNCELAARMLSGAT